MISMRSRRCVDAVGTEVVEDQQVDIGEKAEETREAAAAMAKLGLGEEAWRAGRVER
jgi:hypothetical protein